MCEELALAYARGVGRTNDPQTITNTADRALFLRSPPFWTCIDPSGNIVKRDPSDPFKNASCMDNADSFSEKLINRPTYHLMIEEGFIPWVHSRGLKCIHHVTGVFHGIHTTIGETIYETDPVTKQPRTRVITPDGNKIGTAKQPKDRPMPSICSAKCFQVTEKSTDCFDCVAQALVDFHDNKPVGVNSVPCPDAFTDPELASGKEAIASILQKSVACKGCIAQQAIRVNKHGAKHLADGTPTQAALDMQTNDCWKCVLGYHPTHSFVQSTDFIVLMVCLGIILLTASIVGVVVLTERSHRKATTPVAVTKTPSASSSADPDDIFV
jgi:hypothetical protein